MKKMILSAMMGAALFSTAFAQTQRMLLIEGFSQASCGPCASQNPALFSLVSQNTSKVISLKYQTSWPGTDPMNVQTQAWVAPRVTYYTVTGVPDVQVDGNYQQGVSPGQVSQASIDTRYAVPSPFAMTLSHSFSPAYDSIYVTLNVTASAAVSGALVLQTVIAEKNIVFNSPPGTNGESEFHGVMRTMYPDAAGTLLPAAWTVGQSQNFTFAIPTPSYIYSIAEIEVVAFIQNNTTKEVHQAAISEPLPVSRDAAVAGITAIQSVQCDVTTFNADVILENKGTDILTSCDINVELNSKLISTTPWTGSLATGATLTQTLSNIPVTAGGQKLRIYCSNPNGGSDLGANNDSKITTFVVAGTPSATAVAEKFGVPVFPPAKWGILNVQADARTWARNSAGFNGNGSARIEFYNIKDGDVDELFMPAMDLSTTTNGVMLTFDMAGAGYAYSNGSVSEDTLRVELSNDCGATWNVLWEKLGSDLYTATAITAAYTPKAAEWRNESIDLSAYQGNANVLVKFSAHSNYGNNVYLDNVNTTFGTGISAVAQLANGISLFPNPANEMATASFSLNNAATVTAKLYNALGAVVRTMELGNMAAGEQQIAINLNDLAAGMYVLHLNINGASVSTPLTVAK